jgi:nucleoid-associated protein YgaU
MGNDTSEPDFSGVNVIVRPQAVEKSPVTSGDPGDTPSHVSSVLDETTIYTVMAGDSLSKIAEHFYGDANARELIFDANRDQLTEPDRIKPGQMLKIPRNPETGEAP